MFRRNNRNDVLPSTTYGTGGGGGGGLPSPFGGGGGNSFDGSGRSIKVGPIETSDSVLKSNQYQEQCIIENITITFDRKSHCSPPFDASFARWTLRSSKHGKKLVVIQSTRTTSLV